jgi:hypothetical protein
MLLVMSTAGIFEQEDYTLSLGNPEKTRATGPRLARSDSEVHRYSALWQVTWERIDCFLPNLKQELFLRSQPSSRASSPQISRAETDVEPTGKEQSAKVEGKDFLFTPFTFFRCVCVCAKQGSMFLIEASYLIRQSII